MVDERRLDLDRREPVARDVHHVVDPAEQPEVAVGVDPGAVAREVVAREARPVGLAEALVVAEDAARHRGPGPLEHEVAAALLDPLALLVQHGRLDAGKRLRRRARLRRRHTGQRRDHDHPRLGLPPRVDDRAAPAADVLVVPHPRLGVDRLADRAEQAQRREVVRGRVLGAPLHVRPDRGRRGVEDRDAVALDDLPPALVVREVGVPSYITDVAPLQSGP